MNDTEVNKTILQMVRFIKQEADEKAREIMVTAEEEFNITKLQLLEAERAKIKREYERKESSIEVRRKVELSKQLNESRLTVLRAREEAMQEILKEAQARLLSLARDHGAYKALLIKLLHQALQKLGDSRVKVRCRKIDVDTVKSIIPEVKNEDSRQGRGHAVDIVVDEANPLPPAPTSIKSDSDEFETCLGGVIVTSMDGRIVCSNTLDDRLRIAYSKYLPEVRACLFGEP